ncbi:MAG: bifunctional serine/threonine-protein kinase/formylglycine-generating enzyme family protein [Pseudanabaena sp. ELA607]
MAGLLIGRFRIGRSLGAGSFGETFLAEDTQKMNAPCVVKRLITPNDPAHIAKVREMFEREAKKLDTLSNEGIPKLIAYFEDGGDFYLVQDFIDGNTLDKEINSSRKWTEAEVTSFLLEVLEILAYVHSQDSIHRDIKPNNMMRRKVNQKLVLIDFGAVREVRQTTTNLAIGTTNIGTPGYSPAEQSQGKPCYASDVYAIGCIVIQALTGLSPCPNGFETDPNTGEIKWRHLVRVSDGFAVIIDKMVRYDWRQRYSNGGEALAAVQALVAGNQFTSPNPVPPTVLDPPPIPQTPPVTGFPRRKLIIGLGVATPLAIVAWDWWKRKSYTPTDSSANPPIQTKTLNDIITVNANAQEVSRTSATIQYFTEPLNLLNGAVPLEMALIPKGNFMMGMPSQERQIALESGLRNKLSKETLEKWLDTATPTQSINFPQDFYIGRYAVTQAQWLAVMGKFTDSFNKNAEAKLKGDNRPMIYVSWHEAREFCKRLTAALPANRGIYRLPTEAEWEYACRAGTTTTTPFHFGETITPSLVNYNGNYPYANAPKGEYRQQTVDVNNFTPNAWGLYQMHGNVWEWCLDEYTDNYSKKPSNLKNNGSEPYGDMNVNENDNRYHLLHGGSWVHNALNCRSTYRFRHYAQAQNHHYGFRVVFASLS